MRKMELRLCIACSKEVPPDSVSCKCGHVFEGSRLSVMGKRYTDQRACSEATFLHNPDDYFFSQKLKQKRKKPLQLLTVDENNNKLCRKNEQSTNLRKKSESRPRRPSPYRRRRRRQQKHQKNGWSANSAVIEKFNDDMTDEILRIYDTQSLDVASYSSDVMAAALDEINKKLQTHIRFWGAL